MFLISWTCRCEATYNTVGVIMQLCLQFLMVLDHWLYSSIGNFWLNCDLIFFCFTLLQCIFFFFMLSDILFFHGVFSRVLFCKTFCRFFFSSKFILLKYVVLFHFVLFSKINYAVVFSCVLKNKIIIILFYTLGKFVWVIVIAIQEKSTKDSATVKTSQVENFMIRALRVLATYKV